MPGKLVASVEERRSGARVIKLAGALDEAGVFDSTVIEPSRGKMLINLAGIDRINSFGAREWINWLTALESKGAEIVLLSCSPAIVAHLNRVKNFASRAVIKSFQAPYHCPACNTDKLPVLYVADMDMAPFVPPKPKCDACGSAMTFAEDPQTYFAFLEEQTKRVKQAIGRGSNPHLASRDSSPVLTAEQTASASSPRTLLRDSRPSLSAYQIPGGYTGEHSSIRDSAPQDRRYLVAVIAIAVLAAIALVLLAYWLAI